MPLKNKIYMETQDKVKIVGNIVLPDDDIEGASLLLHMMPATRMSYENFQNALAVCGVASLAIDLRGHGESIFKEGSNSVLDYKSFSNEEHQKSIFDVGVAYQQLLELTHVNTSHTSIIGASIGSSLAIQFIATHSEIPLAILLSPGLAYKALDIEPFAKQIATQEQRIVSASSKGDRYSFDSQKKLSELLGKKVTLYTENGEVHGTDLFEREEFAFTIIEHICHVSQKK